ncbi:MAG: hypothetical protein V7K90_06205 [Nostoc sp.]|uniref:hypothetical protein n=1 Tax=Nostoc sp. TaxID=1180 RepID=UPI002FF77B8F
MTVKAHVLELETKYYTIFQDGCSIIAAFDMILSKARSIFLLGYTPKQTSFIAWQLAQSI